VACGGKFKPNLRLNRARFNTRYAGDVYTLVTWKHSVLKVNAEAQRSNRLPDVYVQLVKDI